MVKIVLSKTNKNSKNYIYNMLKNRDKNFKHIIVVPDRCTLKIEQELFEKLNEDCFFDIVVTTLTTMCRDEINKTNNTKKILSKHACVTLIRKILIEQENNLTTFKNCYNSISFCREIFETICMFKSCNIKPFEIDVNSKFSELNNKLKDIKLIYDEYENFLLNDFTDSYNQLSLFSELINKDTYKNTIIYFLEFPEFTKLGLNIINKLLLYNYDVVIGTTKNEDTQNNSNIYLNAIYFDILQICADNNYKCKTIFVDEEKMFEKQIMQNNVFSYNIQNLKNDTEKIKVLNFSTIENEVKYVARQIKLNVINNKYFYKDVNIILPNVFEYKNYLTQIFDEFDIPYFIDESEYLSNNIISRTILNILQILALDINKYNVTELLKNPIFNFDKTVVFKYENLIKKYNLIGKYILSNKINEINDDIELLPIINFLNLLNSTVNKIKKADINTYIQSVNEFLNGIDFNNLVLLFNNTFLNKNDILQYRKLNQANSKLIKIFDDFKLVFGKYDCSFSDFYKMYKIYVSDITISLPPLSVDCVYIGDAFSTYFSECKHEFILGNNDGVMPTYQIETGIITDKEINSISNKNKLAPTIEYLNKKKKFKVFENSFNFTDTLTLSYANSNGVDSRYPSICIQNILSLFNIKNENGNGYLNYLEGSVLDESKFVFNNFNYNTAKNNFVDLLQNDNVYLYSINKKLYSYLYYLLNDYSSNLVDNINFENIKVNINDAENVFFKNNSTSVSQFEKYFDCPYKHFVKYVLKLTEPVGEIKANDAGNIIHKFLKIIEPLIKNNYLSSDFENNLPKLCEDTMQSVINEEEYSYIRENLALKNQIKSFKTEAIRIGKALIYQQKNSSYKSIFNEFAFANANGIFVKTENKNLKLVGFIDRVDTYKNRFRIIDYKTGGEGSKFSNFTDLFYGKKIQLFVYLKAFKKLYPKMISSGAFYLPILNTYSDTNALSLYKLNGVIENSEDNIIAMDNNLNNDGTSNIIKVQKTSKGGFKKSNLLISESEIEKLCDYAFDLIDSAKMEIVKGNIQPNPLWKNDMDNSCKNCDYRAMCNYNVSYNNIAREMKTVKNFEEFMKLVNGENIEQGEDDDDD